MKKLGFGLATIVVASLVLMAVAAIDPATAAAHAGLFADPSSLLLAAPVIGLPALRDKLTKREALATAKRAEITDGLAADVIARIEGEHAEILAKIEKTKGQIAEAERAEAAEATRVAQLQTQDPAGASAAQIRAAVDTALAADRERVTTITTLATRANVDRTFIDQHINARTTVADFRTALLDEMATRAAKQPQTFPHVSVGETDVEKRAVAMESALLHRFDPAGFKLEAGGSEYRGMSLLEMGRDFLESKGVRTRGLTKQDLAGQMLSRSGGFLSTSDFPNVLANVANKTLRQAYDAAPQTFRPLVRVTTVPDFKPVSRTQLGEAPQLEKVNEHGEFHRGKMGDSAEKYSVATYGKIVAVTRQVLINDDLGAFTRIPRAFGIAAANLESDLVWAEILANANMNDGNALFSAAHGNLAAAGAAISVTTVGAGRTAMSKQTGLDGITVLNIDPVTFLVPKALQVACEQFVGQIYPATTANQVPDSLRRLGVIAEPRLDNGVTINGTKYAGSATNWFLAASPNQIDTIELAYLEGAQGVYTETRMGFDVDGMEVKVRLDAGAKAIDWRGFWKNPA